MANDKEYLHLSYKVLTIFKSTNILQIDVPQYAIINSSLSITPKFQWNEA